MNLGKHGIDIILESFDGVEVGAVAAFRALAVARNQPCFFKVFQMLRNRRLRERQLSAAARILRIAMRAGCESALAIVATSRSSGGNSVLFATIHPIS